jgi:hypothetical protein
MAMNYSSRKLQLWSAIAACACLAAIPVKAAVDAVSESFVAAATVIRGNNGSGVHPTALSLQSVQPVLASGTISSLSGATIADVNAAWADDEFNGTKGLHYVEFSSGLKVDIADTVAATKSLVLADEIQRALRRGESYRVRKHTTVAEIFGSANDVGLRAGNNSAAADDILLFLPDLQRTMTVFYANVPGFEGWYRADYTPASDQVLYPDQGLIVQRKTQGDLVVYRSGPAAQGLNFVPILPGFNLVGTGTAVRNLTLAEMNLVSGTSETGLRSGRNSVEADNLVVFNPDGSTTTFFHVNLPGFEGWYTSTYAPANEMVIPAGSAFFLRRKAPGEAFEWSTPIN